MLKEIEAKGKKKTQVPLSSTNCLKIRLFILLHNVPISLIHPEAKTNTYINKQMHPVSKLIKHTNISSMIICIYAMAEICLKKTDFSTPGSHLVRVLLPGEHQREKLI